MFYTKVGLDNALNSSINMILSVATVR